MSISRRKQSLITRRIFHLSFFITLLLSVVMDAWSKFFSFIQTLFQSLETFGDNKTEVVQISLIFSASILIIFSLVIFFPLLDLLKDVRNLQRDFMIIENVKSSRK